MAEAMIPLMITSAGLSAYGSIREGQEADAAGKFTAAQLNQQAGQTRASAQRASIEQQRQGGLLRSKAVAVNSAGGGGYDKSMEGILAGISSEATYRSLSAMYEGEEAALGMETQAVSARTEGKRKKRAGYISAGSQLMSAAGAMYGRPPGMDGISMGQNDPTLPWRNSGV